MSEVENSCLEETCQTWPILNEVLDSKVQHSEEKVTQAKNLERMMLQQTHESDGSFSSTTAQEARFTADMEIAVIEALRSKLKDKTNECPGDRCVLAAYCVEAVVVDEIDLMT